MKNRDENDQLHLSQEGVFGQPLNAKLEQMFLSLKIERAKPWLLYSTGILLFTLIPIAFPHNVNSLAVFTDKLIIFLCLLTVAVLVNKCPQRKIRAALSLVISFYYLLIYFALVYKTYLGTDLDLLFIVDFYRDALTTALNTLGPLLLGGVIVLFIVLWIVFFFWWHAVHSFIPEIRWWHAITAAGMSFVLLFVFFQGNDEFIYPLIQTLTIAKIRNTTDTIQSQYEFNSNSNDNVFILQLESLNAMAANGQLSMDGKKYDGDFIPVMRSIAKEDGVFFPYFWANETNTNRAQEVILCGIVGNLGEALSNRLDDIKIDCLPETLAKAGYTTVAFRSDYLEFENEGEFLKKTGFQEVHFKDIMKGEPKYWWGYDDCVFYKRAFEYLKEHFPNPKKLLVFVEVSTHHVPFNWEHPPYTYLHKFKTPLNFIENYLNSLLEQDHCVQTFYDEYKDYAGERSHLFALADHSWPTGINEDKVDMIKAVNPEQMLTSLIYIPPTDSGNEFRKGAEEKNMFSQADLVPTIYELLSKKPYPNSLAYVLKQAGKRPSSYEDCHLLVQAYHWAHLGIVKNQKDFYKYNVENGEFYTSDISKDLLQSNIRASSTKLSIEEFKKKYFCKRYQSG